jgi:hypothetical protein
VVPSCGELVAVLLIDVPINAKRAERRERESDSSQHGPLLDGFQAVKMLKI